MENLDLFEYYEQQPQELKQMVDKYLEILDTDNTDTYLLLSEFHEKVNKIGYTFNYDLDGIPYDLVPISKTIN